MFLTLLLLQASASPDRPLARAADPVVVNRYAEVQGNRPRYKRSRGRIEAWVFPDGTLEHYRVHDAGQVIEEHRFDAAGRPHLSIDWSTNTVVVHELGSVDISDWTRIEAAGISLLAPGPATEEDEDVSRWVLPVGEFTVQRFKGPLDPFADAFREGLLAHCACLGLDRGTVWIGARTGVRYRVIQELGDVQLAAEIWALPAQGDLIVATWKAETPHLAVGRALATFLTAERP